MNWTFAGAVSLGLHVVVLLLFAWSSGESEPQAARRSGREVAEETVKAETAETVKVKAETAEKTVKAETAEKTVKAETEEKVKVKAEEKAVETYVVRKGDMLTHIAQDCGCTIQELARINGTTARKLANLRVGQKIKVPRKGN